MPRMRGNKRSINVYLPDDLINKVRQLSGYGRPYDSVSDCLTYLLEKELSQYDDSQISAWERMPEDSDDNGAPVYVASDPMGTQLGPPRVPITRDEFFYAGEQIAENPDISDEDRVKYHAIIRQYQLENNLIDRQ